MRVEEIDDPLRYRIRLHDKLVDELAKGRPLSKVRREDSPAPTRALSARDTRGDLTNARVCRTLDQAGPPSADGERPRSARGWAGPFAGGNAYALAS